MDLSTKNSVGLRLKKFSKLLKILDQVSPI